MLKTNNNLGAHSTAPAPMNQNMLQQQKWFWYVLEAAVLLIFMKTETSMNLMLILQV
jgi:hypothetical protein